MEIDVYLVACNSHQWSPHNVYYGCYSWDLTASPISLQSHKRCKVPVTKIWHTVDSLYCYCAALGSEALDEKAVREGIMGVH